MESIITINIDIPSQISKKVSGITKKLGIGHSNYTSTPHITLHLSKFLEKEYQNLYEDILSINYSAFSLNIQTVEVEDNKIKGNLFLFLKISNSKPLFNLHKKFVYCVNKHRHGLIREKDLLRIKQGIYSKKEVDYINQYGYSRILDLFRPHITLGECEKHDKNLKEIKEELNKFYADIKDITFKVNHINLSLNDYDMGKDKYEDKGLNKKILF